MKAMAVVGLLASITVQGITVDFAGVSDETALADLSFTGVTLTATAQFVYFETEEESRASSVVRVRNEYVEALFPFSDTPETQPWWTMFYESTVTAVFDTPQPSLGFTMASETTGGLTYVITDGVTSETVFGGSVGNHGSEGSHTFTPFTIVAPEGWLIESFQIRNTDQGSFGAAIRFDDLEFPLSVQAVPDGEGPAIAGLALCALGLVAMRQKGGKPA